MATIIALNGPPGSGKDTAASALSQRFQAFHYKLSHPLKVAIPALLGIEDRKVELENHKDEPMGVLFGKSFRELQIELSEKFIKPVLGQAALASIAVQNIRNHIGPGRMCVVSDLGFQHEVDPLIRLVGKRNLLILQLVRDGCDFSKDSRSYVEHDDVTMIQLHNKHDLEMFRQQVVRAVERWHDGNKTPR